MKSYSYYAVVYKDEIYCIGCLPKSAFEKYSCQEDNSEIRPIFAGEEWDIYPCCSECGFEHTYVSKTPEENKWNSAVHSPKNK